MNDVLDRPSVKAVIADFDVNCNWSKLALAISCLKRKDVLYITGTMDTWVADCRILGEYSMYTQVFIEAFRYAKDSNS